MPILRFAVVLSVVGLRLLFHQDWWGSLFLVIGWGVGHLLAEADDVLYVAACNPHELSCQRIRREVSQRNWKNAWGLLKETRGERTNLPVHNILSGFVISVLGIWLVTSGANILATGIVLGLQLRLFLDFFKETNFGKWYWIFARGFSDKEHKIVKGIWGILIVTQLTFLVRG